MSLDLRQLIGKLEASGRLSLEASAGLALTNGHRSVEMVHWLMRLMDAGGPFAAEVGRVVGPAALMADLTRTLDRLPRGSSGAPSLSPTLVNWLREAWLAASLEFGREQVAELDLLYALMSEPILASVAFEVAPRLRQVDARAVEAAASGWSSPDTARAPESRAEGDAVGAPAPGVSEALGKYTIDLTAMARAGKIDPIIGRDGEIRQVVDILSRRRQNNPILVGEAGVGKTAVVEGFAMRIAAGDVPPALRDVELRSLDLGLMQAGASAKGEFEQRLKGVIEGVKKSARPVILFIDEAHTLVGAGGQAGQGDAANLIKPELARGELRTIAATTWAEYKKYFERDAALTRRFQTVKVDEPDHAVAVAMMRGLVPVLEKHHGVRILEEALHDAVRLSARYIPARQLPDKCLSLLDTAAASVAIARTTAPAPVEDAGRMIERLDAEHAALTREGEATRLPEIERRRDELKAERDVLHARWQDELALVQEIEAAEAAKTPGIEGLKARLAEMQGEQPLVPRLVGRDAVAGVVTRWTGIPVGRMLRDDVANVLGLEQALQKRVIGQDHAIAAIASAMQVSRAHLADPRKPVGVFLLVGTSGVGKTETAVALAEQLYGGPQALTTINLSEFKEEHKVSMLVGSPPGYVGYGEGGVLTEAVRRRPHGVLLLDEVEKAHPGVQDVFYQVFDKGSLRDGEGRDIDFRNTTILLTANVGSDLLQTLAADPETMPDAEALESLLRPELLKVFKPAFLGRIIVVPYLPLSDEILGRIVRLQLDRVRDRSRDMHGVAVDFAHGVEDDIIARARNVEIGARAIEQIVARELLPLLSRFFLERLGEGTMPQRVVVAVGEGLPGRFVLQPGRATQDRPDGAPAAMAGATVGAGL